MNAPQFMTDINIFLTAIGHLGTSSSMALPKIETMKDTKQSGGFEKEISTGIFSKLSCECTLDEYSKEIYTALANSLKGGKGASIICKGSIMQDGTRIPAVAYLDGGLDFDAGSWEAGKKIEAKMTINPKVYRLEVNGVEVVSIDTENMICIIDGFDYFEDLRKQIM